MIIDQEFKKYLIPLKLDEFAQLEENIIVDGCREPLVLWGETLIDGHNRLEICLHNAVSFETVSKEFENRESVIEWIEKNQLGRRNLTPDQFKLLLGRRYNRLKSQGFKGNQYTESGKDQNDPDQNQSTSEKLANEHGVSAPTVKRAGAFAESIDANATPELINKVESGVVSVSAAASISELPEEEQTELIAKGEKEILQAAKEIRARKTESRRTERIENIAEIAKGNSELNTGTTYPVIYADPPWCYEYCSTDNRQIENHYPTMDLDEICAMPVGELATQDSILFLWTTSPKLTESIKVLDSWGFEYRTCAVWDKQKIGMGYYFRQQHEILLIATKGKIPVPPPSARHSSVISIDRGLHSEKPERFYEIIESMYPELPKIELFCRSPRAGWSVWGNQS